MPSSSFENDFQSAGEPVSGELLGADDRQREFTSPDHVEILRALSRWTDTVFEVPGLGWRFGLDPILGLLPFVGDLATSVIALYVLAVAKQMNVPRSTLLRMGLNIGVDYVVGAIPLLGNVFDFAWKANHRNVQLLERSMAAGNRERRQQSIWDWAIIVALFASIIGALILSLATAILIAGWVLELLRGG